MEKNILNHKWAPFIMAFAIAFVVMVYYVVSGQGSLDSKTRELSKDSNVAEINLTNRQRVSIKCKSGESYEIVFTQDQQNYDQLIFDSCGAEGGEATPSPTTSSVETENSVADAETNATAP